MPGRQNRGTTPNLDAAAVPAGELPGTKQLADSHREMIDVVEGEPHEPDGDAEQERGPEKVSEAGLPQRDADDAEARQQSRMEDGNPGYRLLARITRCSRRISIMRPRRLTTRD
jgi:hypothetical protein